MICFQPCGKKLPQMDHAENTRWCLFFSFHYSFSKCKNKYSWRNKLTAQKKMKSDCSPGAHFLQLQNKPISYDFKKKVKAFRL